MITFIIQGIDEKDLLGLIDEALNIDHNPEVLYVGNTTGIEIEYFNSESNECYTGARALYELIECRKMVLSNDRTPDNKLYFQNL